jgi:hypothetical protein
MGRPKKQIEVTTNNGPEIDNTINTEQTIELIKPNVQKEEVQEQTIHDKYRKYINQAKSNFIRDLNYASIMEILRWVEKKTGRTMPINTSCSACIIQLIKIFSSLE